MTPLWAVAAAERFWAAAGGAPPAWPRDLRRGIALTLPLAVVDLPRPRVATIDAWLAERGVAAPIGGQDRSVRACLIVRQGTGFIFLDGADPEDERRFSLAHEVAHYLVEHALPRARAAARLGPGILPVVDRLRPPTAFERLDALLAGITLDVRTHLLERTAEGWLPGEAVSVAEARADALAIELLAPIDSVRPFLVAAPSPEERVSILRLTFGLPPVIATTYARRLHSAGHGQASADPFVGSLFRPGLP